MRTSQIHCYSSSLQHSLAAFNKSNRQEIRKNIIGQNNGIDQLNLIDMYRSLSLTTARHTFFASSRGTFTKSNGWRLGDMEMD